MTGWLIGGNTSTRNREAASPLPTSTATTPTITVTGLRSAKTMGFMPSSVTGGGRPSPPVATGGLQKRIRFRFDPRPPAVLSCNLRPRGLPMRRAVVCITAALGLGLAAAPARPADSDPEYDGKKASAWVDTLRNDSSARKRATAVVALGRLWADHQYKDALPTIGRALRLDASPAVRAQAAVTIGRLKPEDARSIESDILDALKGEKESRVRRET